MIDLIKNLVFDGYEEPLFFLDALIIRHPFITFHTNSFQILGLTLKVNHIIRI